MIKLPEPNFKGKYTLEEVLKKRRTCRDFVRDKKLTIEQISQLLWATYGITETHYGLKTAPSAGARYPLDIYVAKEDGVFKYIPEKHALEEVLKEDVRKRIATLSWNQEFIADAPCVFIFYAVYERTTSRYGERGIRYVHFDLGHAAQNLLLQAEALDLGACPVGAFNDSEIKEILKFKGEPIYIIPVGYKL
ncbi:MAG: SagB/ThcOx family dehydrogenase [candidate division WOR-3 bacterium]